MSNKNKRKFSDFQKQEMLKLIADRTSWAEIRAYFKEKYPDMKPVYNSNIQYYGGKYKDEINQIRAEFEEDLSDEILASKRNRIKTLQRAMAKAKTVNEIVKINQEIRREMEGIQITQTITAEIKNTNFPPEPKSIAEWEQQVFEAEKARKLREKQVVEESISNIKELAKETDNERIEDEDLQ